MESLTAPLPLIQENFLIVKKFDKSWEANQGMNENLFRGGPSIPI